MNRNLGSPRARVCRGPFDCSYPKFFAVVTQALYLKCRSPTTLKSTELMSATAVFLEGSVLGEKSGSQQKFCPYITRITYSLIPY